MADAKYIIELILNARNDASRVLQTATKDIAGFNREMDDMERETTEGMDRFTKSVDGSRKSLKELREEGVKTKGTVAGDICRAPATRSL